MRNPNVSRSLKKTFYHMTRRYGEPGYIYKVETGETNYDTGEVTRDVERTFIRKMVRVPSSMMRQVVYTPAMMQSLRQFAWQGGGTDVEQTVFMVFINDLKDWCEIEPSQWINYDNTSYQIDNVGKFDGGWLLGCKQAEGSGPNHWQDKSDLNDCDHWND